MKGFEKISLAVGETREVIFRITEEDLKFYDANLKFVAEPGAFKVFVGSSSKDVQEKDFTLTGL
ncbi:fibronectin type III-like domain-contianing protein [Hufsiella ginkgonis]|uniref:fibronectin type III-like domain-contianing protein n=1 Tax=Hufsiella ginkgonis TaxID=2695274 RepID=UPI001926F65E